MKVTMAISTIEIKIVERFAPIQLNMENHSFAFAKFSKAQALSVVASSRVVTVPEVPSICRLGPLCSLARAGSQAA